MFECLPALDQLQKLAVISIPIQKYLLCGAYCNAIVFDFSELDL